MLVATGERQLRSGSILAYGVSAAVGQAPFAFVCVGRAGARLYPPAVEQLLQMPCQGGVRELVASGDAQAAKHRGVSYPPEWLICQSSCSSACSSGSSISLPMGRCAGETMAVRPGGLALARPVGDDSVRLVSTPGQSHGHLSVVLRTASGPVLLVGDAATTRRAIAESHDQIARADLAAYRNSFESLSNGADANPAAPHHLQPRLRTLGKPASALRVTNPRSHLAVEGGDPALSRRGWWRWGGGRRRSAHGRAC